MYPYGDNKQKKPGTTKTLIINAGRTKLLLHKNAHLCHTHTQNQTKTNKKHKTKKPLPTPSCL